MRLRKPRPASPEEVRITRDGDTAVIEYADPRYAACISGSVRRSRE